MAISEQQVQSALKQLIDPNTKNDFVATKSVRNIKVDGDKVSLDIVLGYPAKSQIESIKAMVKDKLKAVGAGEVTVNVSFKIVSHSVQKGVKLVPGIKNIIAVASGKGGVGKSATAVHVCNLPAHILERMADIARARLARFGTADLQLDLLSPDRAAGPGGACVLWAQPGHTLLAGAEVAQRGVPAEEIAARAARALAAELDAGATLDLHASDQLMIYLALAGERSRFVVREFSSHARTTAWLIEQFLPVRITATPGATGTAVEFEPLPGGVGAQN